MVLRSISRGRQLGRSGYRRDGLPGRVIRDCRIGGVARFDQSVASLSRDRRDFKQLVHGLGAAKQRSAHSAPADRRLIEGFVQWRRMIDDFVGREAVPGLAECALFARKAQSLRTGPIRVQTTGALGLAEVPTDAFAMPWLAPRARWQFSDFCPPGDFAVAFLGLQQS